MLRNKDGFTLVELLAVIVILAVVMLIAVTAVGPMMTRSRISALGTEGIKVIDAAKTAYQAEQLSGTSAIKATSSVCFDLAWLYNEQYFEKGSGASGDGYEGSVLVTYSGGKYSYKYWLTNSTYWLVEAEANGGYSEVNNTTVRDNGTGLTMNNCGGATIGVKCSGTSACA